MFLLIDFGNTRTKVYVRNANGFREEKNIASKDPIAEKEIIEWIESFSIKQCIYSSVIKMTSAMVKFLTAIKAVNIADCEEKLPFIIEYKSKQTLGQDRLAAVCGAVSQFGKKNLIIIQIGTAVTYDYVVNNQYLGGAISPGFSMRLKALHTFTDKLPLIEADFFDCMIGQTTQESILSGCFIGMKSEISTRVSDFVDCNNDSIAIITGGEAKYFVNCIKNSIFALENLTETGLFYLVNQIQ